MRAPAGVSGDLTRSEMNVGREQSLLPQCGANLCLVASWRVFPHWTCSTHLHEPAHLLLSLANVSRRTQERDPHLENPGIFLPHSSSARSFPGVAVPLALLASLRARALRLPTPPVEDACTAWEAFVDSPGRILDSPFRSFLRPHDATPPRERFVSPGYTQATPHSTLAFANVKMRRLQRQLKVVCYTPGWDCKGWGAWDKDDVRAVR